MENAFHLAKILHIISVISLMAALLYLPRLFVYHTQVAAGSEASEMLKKMEYRLLRYIANPALVATWGTGIWLGMILGAFEPGSGGWMHAKLALVLALSGFHGACSVWRKKFAADANTKSERFFRIINEVPTVLMIVIVVLVVAKPF